LVLRTYRLTTDQTPNGKVHSAWLWNRRSLHYRASLTVREYLPPTAAQGGQADRPSRDYEGNRKNGTDDRRTSSRPAGEQGFGEYSIVLERPACRPNKTGRCAFAGPNTKSENASSRLAARVSGHSRSVQGTCWKGRCPGTTADPVGRWSWWTVTLRVPEGRWKTDRTTGGRRSPPNCSDRCQRRPAEFVRDPGGHRHPEWLLPRYRLHWRSWCFPTSGSKGIDRSQAGMCCMLLPERTSRLARCRNRWLPSWS
jgi:hypothetical protein